MRGARRWQVVGLRGKLSPGGSWAGEVASESCPLQRSLQREERIKGKVAPQWEWGWEWWKWGDRTPLVATFWALRAQNKMVVGVEGRHRERIRITPQINRHSRQDWSSTS